MERAPIDAAAIQKCLGPFPEGARALPAEAYLSEAVFAWEMEHFFENSWICVGRAGEIPEPGDQMAVAVGAEAVLLVRDQDETLRGFFNTCRHRGHELLACGAKAHERTIRCPYHRWTYGLDGSFKGGPGLATQEGFDKSDPENSLLEARVNEWSGWVFVNASGDGHDFREQFGDLESMIEPYEPERLLPAAAHEYEIQANWKIVSENYHECYHCSEIHPELCRVSSPYSGRDYEPSGLVVGGSMELLPGVETMSLDGKSGSSAFRRLDAEQRREVVYVQLFPNVLLSLHPDYVMTHRFEPLGPRRTRVECAWLFPPEALDEPGFDPAYASEFWDVTNREDWAACEAVQRGVGGRGYRQGPLSAQEKNVHDFIGLVARGYLEGRARPVARAASIIE